MSVENPINFYLPLLKTVDRKPLQTLESWLEKFPQTVWTSEIVLRNYRRGLKRLIARARRSVVADRAQLLEELVQAALEKVRSAELVGTEPNRQRYMLSDESSLSQEALLDEKKDIELSGSCPPDLRRLAELSAGWTDEQWCDWLAKGFAAIDNYQPSPHLAFAPIRLYPVGRYVNQLCAALTEAADANLDLKTRVIDAAWTYLEGDKSSRTFVPTQDVHFWRLIRSLDARDRPASVARRYVDRQHEVLNGPDPHDVIVSAICDAVWETSPAPSGRASFFEWLRDKVSGPVQDAWLVIALLNEAVAQIWLQDQAIVAAALQCLRIINDSTDEILPLLEVLLRRGKLDAEFASRLQGKARGSAGLVQVLEEVVLAERGALIESPRQPDAIPLRSSRIFAMVVGQ